MVAELSNIVQIEECGAARCNQLLKAGYRLLDMASKAWEADRRSGPDIHHGGPTFIRRDFRYVIGRTADQEPFPAYAPRNGGGPQ